jgi:hypothetical protein
MNRLLEIVAVSLLLTGCAAQMKIATVTPIKPIGPQQTATTQTAGQDAINVSPTVVLTGGSAVVGIVAAAWLLSVALKYRAYARLCVQGIQQSQAEFVKQKIKLLSQKRGIEEAFDRFTKRHRGKAL